MKKGILVSVVVLLAVVSMVQAQESELHGTVDFTYVSRYIWRGYDAYGSNHSAMQPSIDLDLFGTGFGVNVWMSRANKSGFENSEWITYTLYYKNRMFDAESYVTNYKIGYTYFSYPDEPRRGTGIGASGAAQEIFGLFAWPELLPGGLVPSYAVFAYWPSEGKAANRNNGGWAHVFGLGYDLMVPALLESSSEQAIHLGAHTVYNDSVGPAGSNADHDFSHATFSISTDFPITDSLNFSPGFYYQSSWDDSINTSDEYWTSLSLTYKF